LNFLPAFSLSSVSIGLGAVFLDNSVSHP
jgi:hypothetical protein